jgi:5-amino-6-(5-phosphoribosylamino)uracil reductase
MRRLWPTSSAGSEEVDDVAALVAAEDRPPPADRPWILVNMVASLDGGVTVEGRSGGLAGAADKELFGALRQVADVVLAGAGTMRAEDYGPPKATDAVRAIRRERGQREVPRLAVVTRRLDLDPAARLFSDPDNRPCIITHHAAPEDRRAALAEVADFIVVGEDDVDLPAALAQLRADGADLVTCEGGPTLNGTLISHDLIDEWALTISPLLIAGDARRSSRGLVADPRRFRLDRLLEGDGELLGRWVRAR